MISYIEGQLIEKNPAYVIIDCNGIGYFLHISINTYSKIVNPENSKIKLQTYLSIKEDSHTLYGFFDKDEKDVFKHLITVSGVGTNTARMILSSMNCDEVKHAISTGNATLLQSIKGIGTKTAQRIIIDLKDKIGKLSISKDNLIPLNNTLKEEALSALIMLGFNKSAAEKTLDSILKKEKADLNVEQLIKIALKSL